MHTDRPFYRRQCLLANIFKLKEVLTPESFDLVFSVVDGASICIPSKFEHLPDKLLRQNGQFYGENQ